MAFFKDLDCAILLCLPSLKESALPYPEPGGIVTRGSAACSVHTPLYQQGVQAFFAEVRRFPGGLFDRGTLALGDLKPETQDIIVDEVFPHAPETIWKTLTSGDLIGRWMMSPT
jgi:hypothetical protein